MSDTTALTQTLFANGYMLEDTRSTSGIRLLTYTVRDRFGSLLRYTLAVPDGEIPADLAQEIGKVARNNGTHPVIIGRCAAAADIPVLALDEFLARFGGPVVSLLPLDSSYPERLRTLGENKLPPGVSGQPDKLFEEYVRAGIQFLFGTRVIGYGKERSGESVPDGLALRTGRYVMYDAKAASGGYGVTSSEMRKFADYVKDFHSRYKQSHGPAYSFLVVSAAFSDGPAALARRSDELFADTTTTKLTFLDVPALLEGIGVVRGDPSLREGMNWNRLLAKAILSAADIRSASGAARRDAMHERP